MLIFTNLIDGYLHNFPTFNIQQFVINYFENFSFFWRNYSI